jgi:hypothetical protein
LKYQIYYLFGAVLDKVKCEPISAVFLAALRVVVEVDSQPIVIFKMYENRGRRIH